MRLIAQGKMVSFPWDTEVLTRNDLLIEQGSQDTQEKGMTSKIQGRFVISRQQHKQRGTGDFSCSLIVDQGPSIAGIHPYPKRVLPAQALGIRTDYHLTPKLYKSLEIS